MTVRLRPASMHSLPVFWFRLFRRVRRSKTTSFSSQYIFWHLELWREEGGEIKAGFGLEGTRSVDNRAEMTRQMPCLNDACPFSRAYIVRITRSPLTRASRYSLRDTYERREQQEKGEKGLHGRVDFLRVIERR